MVATNPFRFSGSRTESRWLARLIRRFLLAAPSFLTPDNMCWWPIMVLGRLLPPWYRSAPISSEFWLMRVSAIRSGAEGLSVKMAELAGAELGQILVAVLEVSCPV